MGTVENQQGQDIDDSWVRDRKKEFEELIDANHDGIVTMAELEVSAGTWGGISHPQGGAQVPRLPGVPEAGAMVMRRQCWLWGHLEVGSLCVGEGIHLPVWSPLLFR